MQADELFVDAVAEAKRSVQMAKNREASLRKQRKEVMPILKLLSPLMGPSDHMFLMTVYDGKLSIRVSMRKLDGFKDQRLIRVLFAVMCLDGAVEEKTQDYADYQVNREYTFKVNDIDVVVSAYVKSDSETCRRVQVGEEVQVIAKYKIECD